MVYFNTVMSSAGNSSAIQLNWRGGKPVAATVVVSSLFTGDFTVQYTLDDLMVSTSQTWVSFGSTTGSSATHFSSANNDAGVAIGTQYPIAGLRLSSTTFTAGSLTLK